MDSFYYAETSSPCNMFKLHNIESNNKIKECDKIAGARLLLKILRIFGLWQLGNGDEKSGDKNLYRFIQLMLQCLIHIPASFAFCMLMWVEAIISSDLNQAGNVLYMSLALTVYLLKFLNIWFLSKRAYNFIHNLEYDSSYDLYTLEEVEMWQKHQKIFGIVVFVFMSGSVFSGVFAFIGVLFADDYQLGFPYWVPFDWHDPEKYWYAYSFNVMGILVSCLSNVSLDMLGCYMIFHIGLLYKLLGMRIIGLKSVKEVMAVRELRKFIHLHTSIKRMTTECEVLISHYVLAQIIFSALIICFCGFRLQKMNILENLGQFFAMLQFISVMILEIYLPCYFANEITLNSSNLLTNIYGTDWLEFSVTTRKFICLYMEFLKHPVQLKAGNYFDVGLPIFTKVMNNAYSYFALLLNIDK